MRLIRLASVKREVSNRDQVNLARRLQEGLPDSTYTRAEEFFERQAKLSTSETARSVDTAISMPQSIIPTAARPTVSSQFTPSDVALAGHKRARASDHVEPARESKRTAREGLARDSIDSGLRPVAGTGRDYLSVRKEEVDALSPQAIAVAALLGHSRSAQTAPIRVPLTPSGVEASSANNRETKAESTSLPEHASGPDLRSTSEKQNEAASASSNKVDASPRKASIDFYKPFPFRQESIANSQQSPSRIIDRRRARNESLRRKYMEKRLQQQRASEKKAMTAKSGESSDEVRDAIPTSTGASDTPVTSTSTETPTAIRALSNTPASLMNLLNTLPTSS